MPYIKTEAPGVLRDPHSKALVFVDNSAAKREFLDRAAEKQHIQAEINTLKQAVNDIQNTVQHEISELKSLLLTYISDKGSV